jgi:ABC-type cobalamin/Fe3+-siderophores transport system ATPase subunit
MIKLANVTISYEKNKPVLENVSLEMRQGTFYGIIGPNGSGKTSLLNTINGNIQPQSGTVKLQEKEVSTYSSKELAKLVSTLPQHVDSSFSFTVKESVSMGRYAHKKGLFPQWNEYDETIVLKSIEQTKMGDYIDTSLDRLSGGERQRAFLARSLTQESKILLLDEPTNHLDLSHQMNLMTHIKHLVHHHGLTVIGIFHDLNVATVFCDEMFLVKEKQVVSFNKKDFANHVQTIGEAYTIPLWVSAHETVNSVVVQPILPGLILKKGKESVTISENGIRLSLFYRLFGRIEGKAKEEWNDFIQLKNTTKDLTKIDLQSSDSHSSMYKIYSVTKDQKEESLIFLFLIDFHVSSLKIKSLWMDLFEKMISLKKANYKKISLLIGSTEWNDERDVELEEIAEVFGGFMKNSI